MVMKDISAIQIMKLPLAIAIVLPDRRSQHQEE
jgi:protein subunit release factor A